MHRFYWAVVFNEMLEDVPASDACQHLRDTLWFRVSTCVVTLNPKPKPERVQSFA